MTSIPPSAVVLIGGASGAGKTTLSYRLARHLGAALVEVDDLVVAAQAITGARTHPALHHWLTHDSASTSVGEVVKGQVALAQAMEPAIAAVIDNHRETGTSVVIEGDYVVPGGDRSDASRWVIVHDDDVEQLVANYRRREPHLGDQRDRARGSLAYGRWLVERARAAGVPVLAARPWDTAFDRLLAALGLG